MRKVICAALCALVLLAAVLPLCAADDTQEELTLKQQIDRFIRLNGLNEQDFSFSYYNTVTGESAKYNELTFFPSGDAWLFPLHLYFCREEALNNLPIEEDEEVFKLDGLTLEECRYNSIVLHDMELSRKMKYFIGSDNQFCKLINDGFGKLDQDELDDSFYTDGAFCARFLLMCLRTVNRYPERHGMMMTNFRMAQSETPDGMAAFDRPYLVVHYRNEAEGMVCDFGTVDAPQPYLLACYVAQEAGGDRIVAELNALLCDYTVKSYENSTGAQPESTAAQDSGRANHIGGGSRDANDLRVSSPTGHSDHSFLLWAAVALGGAALLAGIGCLLVHLYRRRR